MKDFDWSLEKNQELKRKRGLSFEEVVFEISNGGLIEVLNHPNSEKYSNQMIFVVIINDYVCYVPFVETDEYYFLKTIIPSRKLNKKYKK